MKGTIFLDTTKLEKIRNFLVGVNCTAVILILFFWKVSDYSNSIVGLISRLLEEYCLFEDSSHPAIFLIFFCLALALACILQIVTIQALIRTIEDAQQYHGNRMDKDGPR